MFTTKKINLSINFINNAYAFFDFNNSIKKIVYHFIRFRTSFNSTFLFDNKDVDIKQQIKLNY